jgi:hypothetical protein
VNVEVENETGHELTVLYSGVESKRLVVPVGETGKTTLKPGRYQVGATVAGVRPFYRRDSVDGGEYKWSFVLKKRGDTSGKDFALPQFPLPLDGGKGADPAFPASQYPLLQNR